VDTEIPRRSRPHSYFPEWPANALFNENCPMLSHELLRDEGILIVSPDGPLTAADFIAVAGHVDPYIEANGALTGLMIQARSFPGWEDFGAFVSQLRFIGGHHREIRKVAVLTDDPVLSIMPRLVDHFVSAEVRHFQYDDEQVAFDWIRGR
jgi:hypothetical protein